MLTNASVKAARASARAYKLADSLGLFLHVAPSGRRTFRQKFRWRGREQLVTFGAFPDLTLADARSRRDSAREALRRGEDPRRRAGDTAGDALGTFEAVARRWHDHRRARWSAVHAGDVLASLERHVFPAIGAKPLAAITAPVLLDLLQGIEAAGAFETARRLRQRISAVFSFAVVRELATVDPAAALARELGAARAQKHLPALTEIADARALVAEVEALDTAPAAKLASRFLALTAVRLAAARGARWCEFEDMDGAAPVWRVPAARMKLAAAKKRDSAHDHVVPLSAAAVEVLRAAQSNYISDLVFPGRGGTHPIGEAAIGALYARTRFAGRHVPHGWRATFSTILNEDDPRERATIDLALAHSPKDKVEAAYNRAEQLGRRRRLFERWAALLLGDASPRSDA